jgi:hypothetical protein
MGRVAGQGLFILPGNDRELFHLAILMGGGKGEGIPARKDTGKYPKLERRTPSGQDRDEQSAEVNAPSTAGDMKTTHNYIEKHGLVSDFPPG